MFNFLYDKKNLDAQVIGKHCETFETVGSTLYGFANCQGQKRFFLTLKCVDTQLVQMVDNQIYQKISVGQNVLVEKYKSKISNKYNYNKVII